ANFLTAQVTNNLQLPTSVNSTGNAPDPSAQLDVSANNKGMLVPRMTSVERAAIVSPVNGLLVYDTDTNSFWHFNGTAWVNLTTARTLQDADGNTKVQVEESPNENIIRFDVNGNEAMVIDPTGRVGIGTNAPGQKLDVRGSGTDGAALLSLGNEDLSHKMLIFPGRQNDPNPYIHWKGGDPLRFTTDEGGWSEKMRIDGSGKVGIGTATPDALLDIEGGALLAQGITGTTPVSGAGTRLMWIPEKRAFRAGSVGGTHWDDVNIGVFSFVGGGFDNTASGGNSFVGGGIDNTASGSNSFVGGGEDNIASGAFSFVGGGFLNSASGFNSFVGGGFGAFAKSYSEAVFGTFNTDYTPVSTSDFNAADRLFVIGNGTSSGTRSNAVTVLKGGNVGIGTTSPNEKLHVDGNFRLVDSTIYFHGGTDKNHGLGWFGTGKLFEGEAIDGPALFGFSGGVLGTSSNGGADKNIVLSWKSSGRVGIGRNPVTNLLEVEGNASKSSAGDWLANSDARLKKNIQPLNSQLMLQSLLALRGVTYEWNDDKTGSKRPEGIQYGFTAQNIREVFPTLVEEDKMGYLQTAYGTFDAMA
ncbi:MAG: tail fiber domain-containing protein, partial [Bacteroidota bacterium]